MVIEMKGVAIPKEQITGVGDVKFERGKFAFWVDVPGSRYMQVYKSSEAAGIARQDILDAMNGTKARKKKEDSPVIKDPVVDNEPVDEEEDPGSGDDIPEDGKD